MNNISGLSERNHLYWRTGLAGIAAMGSVAGFSLVSGSGYRGALPPQFFLWAASLWCVLIVIKKPNSTFLTAITLFLILGFPVKFAFHQAFGTSYIEPIGRFIGTVEQWDDVLSAAASGIIGVALAGTVWLFFTERVMVPHPLMPRTRLYVAIEKPLALISVAASIALFVANWQYAFVRIGVEPLVTLPGPLHAIVSFLIQWGLAFWAGCMLYWAWSAGRLPVWVALLVGMIEGCVAGISNLSRARYIFHTLGFVLGWLKVRSDPIGRLTWIRGVVLLFIAVVLAGISLLAVSVDRAVSYQSKPVEVAVDPVIQQEKRQVTGDAEPTKESKPKVQYGIFVSQISKLFVDRWIGMEGVMSVSAYDDKGFELFWSGITEDPKVRGAGIYERISSSIYTNQEGLTFTTTAGGIAILFYSGSYLVIVGGMFLLTIIGLIIERLALNWTASTFAASVASVGIANAICQVNQPYLSFILAVEFLALCYAVWLFRRGIERFSRELIG